MSAKIQKLEDSRPTIGPVVRSAVLQVLEENRPFVMIHKASDGRWLTSNFYLNTQVYEVIGAVEMVKQYIMDGELGDDDGEG